MLNSGKFASFASFLPGILSPLEELFKWKTQTAHLSIWIPERGNDFKHAKNDWLSNCHAENDRIHCLKQHSHVWAVFEYMVGWGHWHILAFLASDTSEKSNSDWILRIYLIKMTFQNNTTFLSFIIIYVGADWRRGRVVDSSPRGPGQSSARAPLVVGLSKSHFHSSWGNGQKLIDSVNSKKKKKKKKKNKWKIK